MTDPELALAARYEREAADLEHDAARLRELAAAIRERHGRRGLPDTAQRGKRVNVSPEHRAAIGASVSRAHANRKVKSRTPEGQAFLDALVAAKKNLDDAAKVAGVSKSLISRAINGSRVLADDKRRRLIAAFGCSP